MNAPPEKRKPALGETGSLAKISRLNNSEITETAPQLQSRRISLAEINMAGTAQMRVMGVDPGTVAEYAEAMEAGAIFPAVILFFDGSEYWPGDGFHRIEATRKIDRQTIMADVRQGSKRDAIVFAVGANADHGLRRSQADKRNAVETLLHDPEWSRMSDRQIAEVAKVDHKTVGKIRREMSGEIPTAQTNGKPSGEIPTAAKVENLPPVGVSMSERLLATVSRQALIAECRRRGLEVVE